MDISPSIFTFTDSQLIHQKKNELNRFLSSFYFPVNIAQAIFAIVGVQLLSRFRTTTILAVSMFGFGFLALPIVIIDASTDSKWYTIEWIPWLLYPFYVSMGGCLGVIELLRGVIPRDIVGEDPIKLRRMDATVYIFYEVTGTASFFTTYAILARGTTYLILLPILFTFAGISCLRIKHDPNHPTDLKKDVKTQRNVLYLYFYSIKRGAQIIFSERRFIWLIPGYVLSSFFHQYIENVLFSMVFAPIRWIGFGTGKFIGALFVLVLAKRVYTPLPWIRLDSIILIVVLWVNFFIPIYEWYWYWCTFLLLSVGWAAGVVSLMAYVQSRLHSVGSSRDEGISPLGCVMAFLYSTYKLSSMVIPFLIGRYLPRTSMVEFFYVLRIIISVGEAIIFLSTFIPKKSFALNPKGEPKDEMAKDDKMESSGLVEAIADV